MEERVGEGWEWRRAVGRGGSRGERWRGVGVEESGGEGWEWRRGVGGVGVEESGGQGWEWRRAVASLDR